jgi:predicted phosphate transport protein (TIGR00153 family)
MKFSLIPRNTRFFDLFEQLGHKMVQASEALADMLQHFENVDMKAAHLKELEHEGDNLTHDLYRLVHQTFVTPFDREDIAALAQSLDDVIDFVEAAGTAIRVYGVDTPTPAARGLADIARMQAKQLESALAALRQRGHLRDILELVKEVNRLENEADALFLSAMGELFQGEVHAVDVIKWRDIYDLLEQATDGCESVAHALEAIVLKHA